MTGFAPRSAIQRASPRRASRRQPRGSSERGTRAGEDCGIGKDWRNRCSGGEPSLLETDPGDEGLPFPVLEDEPPRALRSGVREPVEIVDLGRNQRRRHATRPATGVVVAPVSVEERPGQALGKEGLHGGDRVAPPPALSLVIFEQSPETILRYDHHLPEAQGDQPAVRGQLAEGPGFL